jgi:putative ABC transport system ATP-binding protein
MSIVELRDVTRKYVMGGDELSALSGVSLAIDSGEFVAIVGASGSGKTTMMNMLGLLDRPTTGECLLLGEDVTKLSLNTLADYRNQYIGFIFQSFLLLPKLTVLQNVGLPLLYRKVPPGEVKLRSKAILDKIGMGQFVHHRPNELSGGQQQRVAIARALVGEPKLILADEPTGALDSVTGNLVLDLLKDIHKQQQVTVIIITHDLAIAGHCQRVIELKDGVIVSDDRVAVSSGLVEG